MENNATKIRKQIAEMIGIDPEDRTTWMRLHQNAQSKLMELLQDDNVDEDQVLAQRIEVYLLSVSLFTLGNWSMYNTILETLPLVSIKLRYPGLISLSTLIPLPDTLRGLPVTDYMLLRPWFEENQDTFEWDSVNRKYVKKKSSEL